MKMNSIDLVQAEIKFQKARLAVLEANQAYTLASLEPAVRTPEIRSRILSLIEATSALNISGPSALCRECGADPDIAE